MPTTTGAWPTGPLGQYERAIQDYDVVIRLDPQEAMAYYIRGLVYERLGKTKEAELDFQKAKELGYEP
jgi:Flp pilus assembly protein TadD